MSLSKTNWEAWIGEAITQMYTEDDGVTTIILETGRGIQFHSNSFFYFTTDRPYPPQPKDKTRQEPECGECNRFECTCTGKAVETLEVSHAQCQR